MVAQFELLASVVTIHRPKEDKMSDTKAVAAADWSTVRAWLIAGYIPLLAIVASYVILGFVPRLGHQAWFHFTVAAVSLLAAVVWSFAVRAGLSWHADAKLEYAKIIIAMSLLFSIMNILEAFWRF
jgi:hypothetical protein